MKAKILSLLAMAGLLGASTLNHVTNPEFYFPVVPRSLCTDTQGVCGVMTRREWVAVSAVLEGAAVLGLLVPGTRKVAATATAAMYVGFTAGHISALQRAVGPRGDKRSKVIHSIRLPLQVPLVMWAWSLRKA